MGLTQTKLHHRVLQENWPAICRRLQTEDGKKWVKTKNPCGDYPLHLACYGGHAPPIIIRALIAAYPEALHIENNFGFKPIQLAQSNYRDGHPFREEVLEYLEAYSAADESRDDDNGDDTNTGDSDSDADADPNRSELPRIVDLSNPFITSSTCVVCLDQKADHVVVPCGHLCLCGDCAKKFIAERTNTNSNRNGMNRSAQRYCPVGRCVFTAIVKIPSTNTAEGTSTEVPNQCIVVT